jgi:hypothetical protein
VLMPARERHMHAMSSSGVGGRPRSVAGSRSESGRRGPWVGPELVADLNPARDRGDALGRRQVLFRHVLLPGRRDDVGVATECVPCSE